MCDDDRNEQPADDPHWAKWWNERLLAPSAGCTGSWPLEEKHAVYAVCPELEHGAVADDGQPLQDWFEHSGRAVEFPIRLVSSPPEGAVRVQTHSCRAGTIARRTPNESRYILGTALHLPKSFPEFAFEAQREAIVYVETLKTKEDELDHVFGSLGLALQLKAMDRSSTLLGPHRI